MNYICQLCGYIYDPKHGDPDNNVEPETEFDELPENWVCPLCAAGKEDFELTDESLSDEDE